MFSRERGPLGGIVAAAGLVLVAACSGDESEPFHTPTPTTTTSSATTSTTTSTTASTTSSTTGSGGGGGGGTGGSGAGGGDACLEACTGLYDCGQAECDAWQPDNPSLDLFLNGTSDDGCLTNCALSPVLAGLINPEDCPGTITMVLAIDPSFAEWCEGSGGGGGGG